MIDLSILQCIFANYAANYAAKVAVGVECGRDIANLYTAYSYMNVANGIEEGCDLDVIHLDKILAFQNAQSITIQLCC